MFMVSKMINADRGLTGIKGIRGRGRDIKGAPLEPM
jgi:hypothetical protein